MAEILQSNPRAAGLGGDANQGHSQDNGVGHWLLENVAGPAYNSGIVEPVDTVTSILHVGPKLDPVKVQAAKWNEQPLEWAAQSVGSVAGIVPYIIAGRAVGGASRFAAEATGTEATWFGKFAASERLTQIAGAGVYDFAKPTKNGGGLNERLANAAGGVVAFSLFEFGNSRLNPAQDWLTNATKRAGWGFAGGSLGYAAQSGLGPGHSIDGGTFVQAGLTGGLMNAALPPLQKLATDQISTRIDNALGRGIPAGRYVADNKFGDNQVVSDLANGKNTRLVRVTEQPVERAYIRNRAIGKQVVLDQNADSTGKQIDLARELKHGDNAADLEPKYQKAYSYADPKSPNYDPVNGLQIARQKYIETRIADERSSEAEGLLAGAEAKGIKATAPDVAVQADSYRRSLPIDKFHMDRFEQEADRFVDSGGKFRPTESFSSGGGHGDRGGAGRGSQDRQGLGEKENVFKPVDAKNPSGPHYNEATGEFLFPNRIADVPETHTSKITGEQIDNVKMHTAKLGIDPTATATDPKASKEVWVSERFIKDGVVYKDGQWWGSVELHKFGVTTGYGIADRIERANDLMSVKYHITQPNENGPAPGATFEVYPKGLMTDAHGQVVSIERLPSGTVIYGKEGDLSGWDLAQNEYQENTFGTVKSIDERPDGSMFYQCVDGSYLEELRTPIGVTIPREPGTALPPDEVPDTNAAGQPPTYLVKNIFHGANGDVHYELRDGRIFYLQRANGELFVSKKVGDETVPLEGVNGPITESYPQGEGQYPSGKLVKVGENFVPSRGTEVHPEFVRTYTDKSVIDAYEPPVEQTYGADKVAKQVEYTQHNLDSLVDYTSDKGSYHRYITPRENFGQPVETQIRETPKGLAQGMFVDANGNYTYDLIGKPMPQPGQSLTEDYVLGLNTSLTNSLNGQITRVVRGTDSIYYLTNDHEALQVPLTTGGPIIKHTLAEDGTIASSQDLTGVSDIGEFYPEGRQTPLGMVTGLRVSTDGSVQYTMDPRDPYISDAREWVTPKQIRVGNEVKQLTFAQHLKSDMRLPTGQVLKAGMYRLKFGDGTDIGVTDGDYKQLSN